MSSVIHFKFRNTLTTDIVRFDGEDLSAQGLKEKVAKQKGLATRMGTDFDLVLTNAGTNEEYAERARVPRNSVVVVQRRKLFKPTRIAPQRQEGARLAGIPTRNVPNQFAIASSSEDSEVEYDGHIPRELRCAISSRLMLDPVRLPCCQVNVSRCMVGSEMSESHTCPLCFQSGITPAMLVPMFAMRNRVADLVSSVRRQGLQLDDSDMCRCRSCTPLVTVQNTEHSDGGMSNSNKMSPRDEKDAGRKRRGGEQEQEQAGAHKRRALAEWNFSCTTEFKKRAAQRFLGMYAEER